MKDRSWLWRSLLPACAVLSLTACGQSREVESLGNDVYLTSARGYHIDAQRDALDRSTRFCEDMKLQRQVDDLASVSMEMGFYRVTVTFRCLPAGHPDLSTIRLDPDALR